LRPPPRRCHNRTPPAQVGADPEPALERSEGCPPDTRPTRKEADPLPDDDTPTATDTDASVPVYEYIVESQWAGWWGGYGIERVLEIRINKFAEQGYRLIRTERIWCLWWWWILRPKLLYIFERPAFDADEDAAE